MKKFSETKEKPEKIEDCPSFKEFSKIIADLKKAAAKIGSHLFHLWFLF